MAEISDTEPEKPSSGAADDAPSGPHPYFLAIEDIFLELRGSPLQLSPKDWQVAKAWYEEGIPFDLVEATVRELFARREAKEDEDKDRKVWGLGYCKRAVKAAWRRQQELQAPAAGGGDEEFDLAARLENLASSLPSHLAESDGVAEKIRKLTGGAEAVEGRLAQLDRELFDAATRALATADAEAVETELAASRAALAGRLPAEELERAGDRLREEILRRRLGLPVLSLFALEALGDSVEPVST